MRELTLGRNLPFRVYKDVNDELLMRALTGRATDEELAELEIWKAAAPEHARRLYELQQLLADISGWYGDILAKPAPGLETMMRRAQLRQAPNAPPTTHGRWRRSATWLAGIATAFVVGINAVVLRLRRRRVGSSAPALLAVVPCISGDSPLLIWTHVHTIRVIGPIVPLAVRRTMKPEMLALVALAFTGGAARAQQQQALPVPVITTPSGSGAVEQHAPGTRAAPRIVASFDGLGVGFVGPQGQSYVRNPSDNSLAVGPNHIVQVVNSVVAIYTKKGKLFDTTGKVLYGPVPTNNVFKGFGGVCEARNSGDGVVRYDQLADRWLFVRAVGRGPERPDQPEPWAPGSAHLSPPGQPQQPGAAATLVQPPPFPPPTAADTAPRARGQAPGRGAAQRPQGPSSMCYAISAGPDPLGAYYRYEFLRPYFPDYPRPAVWPDGYYVPTSTGDNRISETVTTQKHACVVERAKMLAGQPAREQCVVIQDVGFLNNADIDGTALPPAGAPNIMIAARGTQLTKIFEASALDVWQFHVDWKNPQNTRVSEPTQLTVAPYHYLCDGQLSNCVSQPGTDRRLDAQGDKIMARVVWRRIGNRESIVAAHSVNTTTGGGAVRWYELRIGANRTVSLYQQGTYLADGDLFRWMPSPAMDRYGNIGIGYSFGGGSNFAGQRFTGRLANDPKGQLTLQEAVLANGEASLTSTSRWEDYTQTAVDPSDDCTIWYVGDYLKNGETRYSSRIGAFRLPGCGDERPRPQ